MWQRYQRTASEKMSSERTLAVQAELVRQPQKAVALMVWRLCSCVPLLYGVSYRELLYGKFVFEQAYL